MPIRQLDVRFWGKSRHPRIWGPSRL